MTKSSTCEELAKGTLPASFRLGQRIIYRIKRFDFVAWLLSRREIRQLAKNCFEIEDTIDATRRYHGHGPYYGIALTQRLPEIIALARLVREGRPKVVVEIGTWTGGTLFIWTRSNPQLELVVSIDLPGGQFGGGYDKKRIKLYGQFVADRVSTQMKFLRLDSHAPTTWANLKTILDGKMIDFLFIDGDHTYEGVKADYEMYSPLVRSGGFVAFHDIVTKKKDHNVCKLWDEIKPRYTFYEFIEDPKGDMGIGVIIK